MNRIVISYRRQDSADVTGRIYDHLVSKFGRDSVFKDVDAIQPGADFRKAIRNAMGTAVVFLAVIGDRWLTITNEERRRRIDDPNDFVRIEIETALKRDILLIPLLVRGACMPSEAELPETLRPLSYRNALSVRDDPDFVRDIERLINVITDVIDIANRRDSEELTTDRELYEVRPSRFMSTPIEEIEEQIKQRLCGQEVAVNQVMPWVKRLRFGLLRDDKPAATFLFVGQSGVGKTLLAKELARVIFGDEEKLLLFEVPQYRGVSILSQLIGASPGYIGENDGRLVNVLRDSPERVLFFDEIDKAEAPVLDFLLRFVDSGFVKDAAGVVQDGRKAIVIFATNAGCVERNEGQMDNNAERMTELMINASRDLLPRELIVRIDEIVCFFPFSRSACRKIIDIAIDREMLQLMARQEIRVSVAEAVRAFITEEFYTLSINQGARAAPRIIHKFLTLPIIDFALSAQKGLRKSYWQNLEVVMSLGGSICVRTIADIGAQQLPDQEKAGDASQRA